MNHNNNKNFVQKKGNDNHNFGFTFSRQSQNNRGQNDSIEDGEIVSSKKSVSPDKLKATPSRQNQQSQDPESQENKKEVLNQNSKSRMSTEQQFKSQNTGNDNNYNQNEKRKQAQNEKYEQIDNDSQRDQSSEKSNENEPEPESMENQEQSQADNFNQNYMNRNMQSQQNIDQLSNEFNRQNRGPNYNRQYQIQQDNDFGQQRYNQYEQKEVSNVKQQNYELSGEEAEMAEMQDDEGVDNLGGERKSINQRNLPNQKNTQEQWGQNNRDIVLGMSDDNPDVQSGQLQQYMDEEESSMQDNSESQPYGQEENNQDSSYNTADDKQQFQQNNVQLQASLPKQLPTNQDEITLSKKEATGTKQIVIEDLNENIAQDFDMQCSEEEDDQVKQKEMEDYKARNYINTMKMSRLGFADDELSQSKSSQSSKSKNESSNENQNDESDQENEEQEEQVQISQPNIYNQSNSNITKSKISPGKQPTIQFKEESESQQSSSQSQKQILNIYSSQQEESNNHSEQKYSEQQKNVTAQKQLTAQKQYQSQQQHNYPSAQKAFLLVDQNSSEEDQQQEQDNQSRISIQVESADQDEESSKPPSNRRDRKSRQKQKPSHIIQESSQSQQYQVQDQSQDQDHDEEEYKPVKGKQSRKSQKTLRSQKSKQTKKSKLSNYQSNVYDNDSEEIQESNSQNIKIEQQSQDQQEEIGQEYIDETENQDEEINNQNDQQESNFQINVEDNFVQNDEYSQDPGVIVGGVDYNQIIQDEESEQSNQESFNYQQSESEDNHSQIIQNDQISESDSVPSNMSEYKQHESESLQNDQIDDEEVHDEDQVENEIMDDSSHDQIANQNQNNQILDQQDDSDEKMDSQSEDQQSDQQINDEPGFDNEYFDELDAQNEDDQIEEDSQSPKNEYEEIDQNQIKQESVEKSEDVKSDHVEIENEEIENSEENENESRQSEQIKELKEGEDEESEEGEYIPSNEEKDSSSNVDTDLVSEEIMIEQYNQDQDNDITMLPTSQINQPNQTEVIKTEVKKEKKKKETFVQQKVMSPRKTRNQKENVKEQPKIKQEIEKFTIQRKLRAAQSTEKKEIEKQKSHDKKDSLERNMKKLPLVDQRQSRDKKSLKQLSQEVEKIEDEINPIVIENAQKRNANRRINLRAQKQSQSSEKHIQKSPKYTREIKSSPQKEKEVKKQQIKEKFIQKTSIKEVKKPQIKEKEIKKQQIKEKEIKISPKKEKEIQKSPIREIETRRSIARQIQKPVKQNYIDNLEEKKQVKAKIPRIDQQKQVIKNREDSPPFSAYQNKDKMIKINQFQIQPKIKQAPVAFVQKQEKQIDNKKQQKQEVFVDEKLKRKTMFGLTSQEDDVHMTHSLTRKTQEVQKQKNKLNPEIPARRTLEPRNSSKQIEEKLNWQVQKQTSIPPVKKHSKEEQNKKPLAFLGFQSDFAKNTPITKLKTPSPKIKEKKVFNDRKSEFQPMKTRNTLLSPPKESVSRTKNQFLQKDLIKPHTRQSKAQSPQRIQSTNDSKSKLKKDIAIHPAKKQSPKKSYSPLKAQEKQKQIISTKETQKTDIKQKPEKINELKQKEEQVFTRKREIKYQEKHPQEKKQVNQSKSISIEKIQTRNIVKPNYALLSLGLIQKNTVDEKPKLQKTSYTAQNFGLGFYNEDSKNQDALKSLKQNKEQKTIEPPKQVAKISIDSFKFDKKQNLKTLIATPSKFKILENKKKIKKNDKSKIRVIQKQDFIIKTRNSIAKIMPEKKDTAKIDQKSRQIKKVKSNNLARKIEIFKNLNIINQKIQTRRNLLQDSKVSKDNLFQQKQKKDEKQKPNIPQGIAKKQFQEKSSLQNTKSQSPEKKTEKKENPKLGLLVKRPRDDKNCGQRNDQRQKHQKPQFQFIETKKQKHQVEQINRGSLFGFVSK